MTPHEDSVYKKEGIHFPFRFKSEGTRQRSYLDDRSQCLTICTKTIQNMKHLCITVFKASTCLVQLFFFLFVKDICTKNETMVRECILILRDLPLTCKVGFVLFSCDDVDLSSSSEGLLCCFPLALQ